MLNTNLPKDPPHKCPCGCGAEVEYTKLACHNGWYLLPADRRNAITRARGRKRLALVAEALTWYRENVRNGRRIADEGKPRPRMTIADGGFPRG
jgi:hypothetical protein